MNPIEHIPGDPLTIRGCNALNILTLHSHDVLPPLSRLEIVSLVSMADKCSSDEELLLHIENYFKQREKLFCNMLNTDN